MPPPIREYIDIWYRVDEDGCIVDYCGAAYPEIYTDFVLVVKIASLKLIDRQL